MNLEVVFKELEHSDGIQKHVEDRASKLERLVTDDEHVRVVVEAKFKGQQHAAEISWHCNKLKKDFYSKSEGHDLYTQIDEAFEKVYRQAQTAHEKLIDRKRHAEAHKKMPQS
jgi:ribosomal subunit interface protein